MMKEMMKVLALVEEMQIEKAKGQWVPKYYKRHGQMVRRSYDERVETERYHELLHSEQGGIRGVKVFCCCKCGEMVDYFSLESWCCDFTREDGCVCSECYEEEMGEDL